jgi:hypothetical protein
MYSFIGCIREDFTTKVYVCQEKTPAQRRQGSFLQGIQSREIEPFHGIRLSLNCQLISNLYIGSFRRPVSIADIVSLETPYSSAISFCVFPSVRSLRIDRTTVAGSP